jgi:DNA-binding MarR family transcriptional regulator
MDPAAAPVFSQDGVPADLADKLTYRMHLLHKLTDLESQRRYPLETGLSLSDGRSLSAFGAAPGLSVNELARLANLDKAQASRAAQSLVAQGLVSKTSSDSDGRGVSLRLTPRGRKARARTLEFIALRNQEIFHCLSEQEQRLLGELFDRVIAHVRPAAVHASA